jgi:F0F1-type ATP synthase membrane subunit b/b'
MDEIATSIKKKVLKKKIDKKKNNDYQKQILKEEGILRYGLL